MSFCADAHQWAELQFGHCELGDQRRTSRLVEYAARQAMNPGGSINEVCREDDAAAEGAYRLIRNEHVKAADIDRGPFLRTAQECARRATVLAIQDTTMLTFKHQAAEQLGNTGGQGHGFVVHSTLAVDAESGEVLGLLDQIRWSRSKARRAATGKRRKRRYEERESYKWQRALARVEDRLENANNIISVCDREADIYEHLQHHVENGSRFVIRATSNRCLVGCENKLWKVMSSQPVLGKRKTTLLQRGASPVPRTSNSRPGRQRREVQLSIRAKRVTLSWASEAKALKTRTPVTVHAVYVREVRPPNGCHPIEWMLLTSEPVGNAEQAARVVDLYEMRWMIEDFHKVWKSGCRIETRRHQSKGNLERIAAVTTHIAVRIMQLRTLAGVHPQRSCDAVLSTQQWQTLYAIHHGRACRRPPSIKWALTALAKLAGWRDSKRTGKPGWETLWKGWFVLEQHVHGWQLATQFAQVDPTM